MNEIMKCVQIENKKLIKVKCELLSLDNRDMKCKGTESNGGICELEEMLR